MNFDLDNAIEILERTPRVMKTLLLELSEVWTNANEGENTWSAFDVVGHLIHGERTDWIPRLNLILSDKPDKTFVPFDRFAQFRDSEGKTMRNLLDTFTALRAKNIARLKSLQLTGAELALKGRHPGLGEVSVQQLLAAWVTHDLGHLAQIARVMAKHYTADVGPWHEYLTILKERS